MAAKDEYTLQSERIIQAVRRLCSGCTVAFDSERKPNWIRFRIDDGSNHFEESNPPTFTSAKLQTGLMRG